MSSLVFKEWRQLIPISGLWIGLLLLNLVATFFTRRMDEQSYGLWCSDYCNRGADPAIAIVLIMLLLVVAYSLYPREFDDSTIDFLHSLPVSKGNIFVAKFVAAWSLVCALTFLGYATDAALLSLNTQSIDGQFYPQVHLTLMLRECLFCFIILAHGVFLSCFRFLGLVIYAMYLFGITYLEGFSNDIRVFNVINVMFNDYDGQRLVVDWPVIGLHLLIAVLLLLISYQFWSRRETTGAGSPEKSNWVRWLQWIMGVLGFLFLVLMMIYQIATRNGQAESVGTFSQHNQYYRFVFPAGTENRASMLVRASNGDYQQLSKLLGLKEEPFIQADMTADNSHIPGIAKWKKIKMDISGFYDDQEYRRILSHETTHVFQSVESGGALQRNFTATRFFIEGMAQYTSFSIVDDDKRRQSNWVLAAVAWKRQNIRFVELLDDRVFSAKYDSELYYSLGDLWTEALVRTCGESSLGDLLRAAGREDAPIDPAPMKFWFDVLNSIGCELESINLTWRSLMEELLTHDYGAVFPEFSAMVFQREPGTNRVRATVNLLSDSTSHPERFRLRIRSDKLIKQNLDSDFPGALIEDGDEYRVEFSLPQSALQYERFWFQLGFSPSRDSRLYFEPWQTGSVR